MKAGTWIPAALVLALTGTSTSAQNNGAASPGTGGPRSVSGQSRFQPSTGGFYGGGFFGNGFYSNGFFGNGFYSNGLYGNGFYGNDVPQGMGDTLANDQFNNGGRQRATPGVSDTASKSAQARPVRFGPRAQAELKNPPGAFRPGQKAVNAAARGERAPGPDPVVANRANDPLAFRDDRAGAGGQGRFGPRAQAELKNRPGAFRPGQSTVNAAARGERRPGPDPVISNRANDSLAFRDRQADPGSQGRFGPRAQQELANPPGALTPGRNTGTDGGTGARSSNEAALMRTFESRMQRRPFIEGKVVAADRNRVQVRYKANAQTGTLNFQPGWVYFYNNRGELATAATSPNLVSRGMTVLVPEMTGPGLREALATQRGEARPNRTSNRRRSTVRVLSNRVVR